MKHWYNDSINEYLIEDKDAEALGYNKGRIQKLTQAQKDSAQISRDELYLYYCRHTFDETQKHYNLHKKRLRNLLSYYAIIKPKSVILYNHYRTHESYIEGGRKSSVTQKDAWMSKSDAEKEVWKDKQKQAHSSQEYRDKISQINKEYRANLDENKQNEQNIKRSNSCKSWWYDNFTEEERKEWIKTSLEHGAGWNQSKLKGSDSKPNRLFAELLTNEGIVFEREFRLKNYSYDFKIDNTLIEINPTATHNSTWGILNRESTSRAYHSTKTNCAVTNGYRCIHVWDWDDCNKIMKLLKPRKRIYARKCYIDTVTAQTAKLFLVENHLQGYVTATIDLGLYYNDKLVSIMTFGKPRYNKKYEWELLRYCSTHNVIGGAEKLFKHFVTQYSPKSIISYCDLSKFSGRTYAKLGFNLNYISIGKHWYNIKTQQHITDNLLRQQGFDRLLGKTYHSYGKGTDNAGLMRQHGFVEVYDAGQATYTKIFD